MFWGIELVIFNHLVTHRNFWKMATTTMSHQAIGSVVSHRPVKASQFLKEPLNVPMKFRQKSFKIEATASQISVVDNTVSSPSKNKPYESKKKSSMLLLFLVSLC